MSGKNWNSESILAKVSTRWGITEVTQTGNEWHSPCPFCPDHGTDRFLIRLTGRYWCRQCGAVGWIDDDDPKAEQQEETAEERQQREAEEIADRAMRLERWKNSAEASAYLRYHSNLTAEHLVWWESQGITEGAVREYMLGYCPQHTFKVDARTQFSSDAYVVPVFKGGTLPTAGDIVNIQFRINSIPTAMMGKVGKYRQVFGIPAANFYAAVVQKGDAFVVEGAKKAIVLFLALGKSIQVVGLPGITPHPSILAELKNFSTIYFIPDPDVHGYPIERAAGIWGKNAILIDLPVKPDDAFVKYGLTTETFKRDYLNERNTRRLG